MGDAENVLPPSKKRTAGRELSRDNPGLDDGDTPEQETGTFQRASDEVLASRRIVKVRRHQSSSTASNPFAGIRLVPHADTGANTTNTAVYPQSPRGQSVPEEVDSTVIQGKTDKDKETEDGAAANEPNGGEDSNKKLKDEHDGLGAEAARNEKQDSSEGGSKPEESDKKVVAEEETKNEVKKDDGQENTLEETINIAKEDKGDENTAAPAAPWSSFQQLSSSQNAFTGLAGTGFSTSSFSFGSIPKDGTIVGGSAGRPLCGLNNEEASFPSSGIGNSCTGSSLQIFCSPTLDAIKSNWSGLTSMQEVPIETGEENEKAVFTADAVLFEYLDGGWKERGKGELKVNVSTVGPEKARLVMRARGHYRLILNASLYPDMKLTNMDKKGIIFACMNSAAGEVKGGLSTFALKFKDGSIVDEFRGAVTLHKGEKTTRLKTPENSPKASDD